MLRQCFRNFKANCVLDNVLFSSRPKRLDYHVPRRNVHKRSTEDVVGRYQFGRLGRPFLFLCTGSCLSFAGASVWQYETMRSQALRVRHKLRHHISRFPAKAGSLRHRVNVYWNNLSPGKKTVACLIALNTAVFLLWKIPPVHPALAKFFLSSPYSGASSWSMLFATFSHYNLWHLVVNMYVLWSFSDVATHMLGQEQFVGMFVTAGIFSSFTSYIHKIAIGSLGPSLGASGAILGVLGAVCTYYPDSRLSIAFIGDIIPHSFSADSAKKAIIVFDTLGILFGWRLFDHAAHLGGMLFGLWYVSYGHKMTWARREKFMQWWHRFRGKSK